MTPQQDTEAAGAASNGADDALPALVARPLALSPEAPEYLAVIAQTPDVSRVAIVELGSGRASLVPGVDGEVVDIGWVARGFGVLFRSDRSLWLYQFRQDRLLPVADGLAMGALRAYALSPDGHRLAIALDDAIEIAAIVEDGRFVRGHSYPLPYGLAVKQLLWLDDDRLTCLLRDADGTRRQLLSIDARERTTAVVEADPVNALLAPYPASGGIVVAWLDPNGIGDEAAIRMPDGELRPLRTADEADAGEFTIAYRAATQESVARLGTEDPGDATRLVVLPPGSAPARTWLEAFPRLQDLSLSPDGGWATFVDNSPLYEIGDPGGDVYVTAFGTDDAHRVLEASLEGWSFREPVLGP